MIYLPLTAAVYIFIYLILLCTNILLGDLNIMYLCISILWKDNKLLLLLTHRIDTYDCHSFV